MVVVSFMVVVSLGSGCQKIQKAMPINSMMIATMTHVSGVRSGLRRFLVSFLVIWIFLSGYP